MEFFRRRALIIVIALIFASPHEACALQSYFINNEVKADNIEMFPKWIDMLSRYKAEATPLDAACGREEYSICKMKEWKTFIAGEQGKPRLQQMADVNAFANRYPYIEDIVNWGVEDYWATVYEFQRKSGDCEDYAIAKYMSLRALGVSGEDMRIIIVQDLNLGGILHAVLIVFLNGQVYVLDNQIKQVMLAVDIYHYKPIYSINEYHWWRHLMIQ
jgi:predicted transglutaminase-like cysteine proteinase